MKNVKIVDHQLVIENGDEFSIRVDLKGIFDNLSDEERQMMAMNITWDEILREAVQRLTGESEFWSSDDSDYKLKILSDIETSLLSGYKWDSLREFRETIKNIASHQHLYWKMWHDPNHGDFFKDWLQKNNIECQYTTKLPDVKKFIQMVDDMFVKLMNDKKEKDDKCLKQKI